MSTPRSRRPFEINSATKREVQERIRTSISELFERDDLNLNQEKLAHVMGFAGQGSVSKIMRGVGNLTPERARLLDDAEYPTDCGHTFVELVNALRRKGQTRRVNVRFDVFLAAPMASADEYSPARDSALKLVEAIEEWTDFSVYYAGRSIATDDAFDAADIAFSINWQALKHSKYFVLYVPEQLSKPSSVWVEAGIALALGHTCTYFVQGPDCLPYILRQAVKSPEKGGSQAVSVHWLRGSTNAPGLIRRHRRGLLDHTMR